MPSVSTHAGLVKGDVCDVSVLFMSSHCGTHMDAPARFLAGADTMDALPWDEVIGPAHLLEIKDRKAIQPEDLRRLKLREGERVLFKTRNSSESWKLPEFDKSFVYISKEGAQYLADCGVQTVGVDDASVGGFWKDGVETHHALMGAGIWIIEGLDFGQVRPGDYELICLPIRLSGGDGAPARCLIRPRGTAGPRRSAAKKR